MSLRFYLNRVSILALIRYNAPRSVSEPIGFRPNEGDISLGLVGFEPLATYYHQVFDFVAFLTFLHIRPDWQR